MTSIIIKQEKLIEYHYKYFLWTKLKVWKDNKGETQFKTSQEENVK